MRLNASTVTLDFYIGITPLRFAASLGGACASAIDSDVLAQFQTRRKLYDMNDFRIARASALLAGNGFALVYLLRFLETHATPNWALLAVLLPCYGVKSAYSMLATENPKRERAAVLTLVAVLLLWVVWRLLP